MMLYRYTVQGIARQGQSDAYRKRTKTVIAYSPEQALAWVKADWDKFVETTVITNRVPYEERSYA